MRFYLVRFRMSRMRTDDGHRVNVNNTMDKREVIFFDSNFVALTREALMSIVQPV